MNRNNQFKKALAALNSKQKEAVQQLDGPMILLAGPGTGKTHVLAARVGQILHQTDTGAEHILCLTYTDAGAHAMRSRLLEWIGPEAHKVTITTFHSFCNSIIQQHAVYFGFYDWQPITELERIKIIRDLIDGLDKDHFLRKNLLFRYVNEKALSRLFRLMKQESWSYADIEKGVAKHLSGLKSDPKFRYSRNTKGFKKGEPKQHLIDNEKVKSDRLLALASCFPIYVQLMQKEKRYEFDDMILWVLEAFQSHATLLSEYQEKFLYILVDEYQDTNGAQDKLLQLLTEFWEEPNLFVVGDDDQAIYEFQGAKLDNLVELYDRFEGRVGITALKENYRSNQTILDASFDLINHNQNRAVHFFKHVQLDKHLHAASKQVDITTPVIQINRFDSDLHEQLGVFEQIKLLLDSGVLAQEIAVLYPQHKHGEILRGLFQQHQIPYQSKRKINVLDEVNVLQIIQEFAYFNHAFTNPILAQSQLPNILLHPHWKIASDDLRHIVYWSNLHLDSLRETAFDHFRMYVSEHQEVFSDAAELGRVLDLIGSIMDIQRKGHLLEFVKVFFKESLWLDFILQGRNSQWDFNVFNSFWTYIKDAVELNPRLDLAGLLSIFDELDSNGLGIEYIKVEYAEDGVHLLTAHGSKGLEFEHVFIIHAIDEAWEKSKQNNRFFTIPPVLFQESANDYLNKQNDLDYQLEAKRRLFYVAMTRAKQKLYFSFAKRSAKGKQWTCSRFISEIQESTGIQVQDIAVPKELVQQFLLGDMQEADLKLTSIFDANWLAKQLEDFVWSATSLRTFLECKRTFFFEYILKLTPLTNVHALYGKIAHQTLLKLLSHCIRNPEPLEHATIVQLFEEVARRFKYQCSASAFEDIQNKGKESIPSFWDETSKNVTVKSRGELPVTALLHQEIPIKGTIDRLDQHKTNTLEVVDYKSSRKTSKIKPRGKDEWGGIYWFQVLFYQVLLDHAQLYPNTSVSFRLEYLEPDDVRGYESDTLKFDSTDVAWMEQLIVESHENLQDLDINENCSDEACKWCGMKISDEQGTNWFDSRFKDEFDEY